MGRCNNICSDKTGALTKNQMTVMGIYIEGQMVENISKAVITPITKLLLCEG